ncbi:MAG: ATP synthase F1 subunit delta [Alphaproteobacteria bacterium]|nr:ATP synthase F1 subunit delta [Alphaproteobacteria bacterium]
MLHGCTLSKRREDDQGKRRLSNFLTSNDNSQRWEDASVSKSSSDLRPVAARYAKALFELASEKKQLDAVKKDLETVASAIEASDAFRRLSTNNSLSREEQSKALNAVLAKLKVGELTRKFFGVLVQNRRLAAAPQVAQRFAFLLAESRDEATAEITSAQPLTAAQLKELKASIKKATGRSDIHVVTKEKPEILGGVIIKVDGKMFDNSVANKISRLAVSLKNGTQAR